MRQRATGTGQLITCNIGDLGTYNAFDYDAYGVALTPLWGPGLYYAGEHFDAAAQNYYLRARWYDPSSGRFTSLDPFAGNNEDPQSLHKYLYCHANPVNGTDPSGLLFLSAAFRRLAAAVGIDVALRLMIGIRATYVLGEAYQKEVNPLASSSSQVKM